MPDQDKHGMFDRLRERRRDRKQRRQWRRERRSGSPDPGRASHEAEREHERQGRLLHEMNADLVLEGGGVKGLGLVGAVLELMGAGYSFRRVAGTSAGSIVAAFVAAGVDKAGLEAIMNRLDYKRVPDGGNLLRESVHLFSGRGAHPGIYIHRFVEDELAKLGVKTFKDLRLQDADKDDELPPYKLVVTTTDITTGRMLRLPWDYAELDLDPDEQKVADAVRASISIPLFFEPVVLEDRTLVDGGVLSNFPIEIFDRTDREQPRWPTIGIKVMPDLPSGEQELFPDIALPNLPPIKLLQQVVMTAIVGHDQTYLNRPCVKRRTIRVDTKAVGIVDFDVDAATRAKVVENGRAAAKDFLRSWSWEEYLHDCRSSPAR